MANRLAQNAYPVIRSLTMNLRAITNPSLGCLLIAFAFDGVNIAGATNEAGSRLDSNANSPLAAAPAIISRSPSTNPVVHYQLAYHLATNAAGYAARHTNISNATRLLSGWNYSGPYAGTNMGHLTNAVWSANCWLAGVRGLSATCIGYTNASGGGFLLSMVSPRHYLMASHVGWGAMIAFLGTNNVVYWRTSLQRVDLTSDVSVGILDADLPPAVGYLPVLPPAYTNYLPTTEPMYIQGIGMNQDMRVFSQVMSLANPPIIWWNKDWTTPAGLGTNWSVGIRGGDSSLPERLLIGNQLVLVSGHTGVYWGPNYACQVNAINNAMHQLSTNNHARTDYQLTLFPLTNWPAIR
jgi:hypothetical protein